jgi:hypothetical protein
MYTVIWLLLLRNLLYVYCHTRPPAIEPHVEAEDPSPNFTSLPIALHKGKPTCTSYPIS